LRDPQRASRTEAKFQTLRHSYATHLLEEGVSLCQIAAYLGHDFTPCETSSQRVHTRSSSPGVPQIVDWINVPQPIRVDDRAHGLDLSGRYVERHHADQLPSAIEEKPRRAQASSVRATRLRPCSDGARAGTLPPAVTATHLCHHDRKRLADQQQPQPAGHASEAAWRRSAAPTPASSPPRRRLVVDDVVDAAAPALERATVASAVGKKAARSAVTVGRQTPLSSIDPSSPATQFPSWTASPVGREDMADLSLLFSQSAGGNSISASYAI
jgi:hypothetical protein